MKERAFPQRGERSMKMKNGLRKVMSVMLAGAMAVGLAVTGGSNFGPKTVEAAEVKDYTTINNVNYNTVLGRGVNYGIIADTLEQTGHMETTFATNMFKNVSGNQNCDIDLAGDAPAYFIISEIENGSIARFGQTYKTAEKMNFYIETNQTAKNSQFKFEDNCKADVLFRVYDKKELQSNVNKMISDAADESKKMLNSGAIDLSSVASVNGNKYTLDLTDERYNNTTVFVNVEKGSALEKAITQTDALKIKKNSNTTVVFNVLTDNSITLSSYLVDVAGVQENIKSTTTHSGDDSEHNKLVDKELCQKIIWNIPNASNVLYSATAGTFVLPNPNTYSECVSSSAGWVVSAGKVKISSGEWHYIYHDRSEDVNTPETAQFHFALDKAFTSKFEGANTQTLDYIIANKDEYTFSLTETESDYETPKSGATTYSNKSNNEYGKVVFDPITTNVASVDPQAPTVRYFVVKEVPNGNSSSNVQTSTGRVELKVTARNDKGIIAYSIECYKYLSSTDTEPFMVEKVNTISGNEFSIGDFINLYDLKTSSIELEKEVTVSDTDKDDFNRKHGNQKYDIAIKKGTLYVQDEHGKLGGTPFYFGVLAGASNKVNVNGLIPGEYEIVEKSQDLEGYNLKSSTIKIDNESKNKVTLDGDTKRSASVEVDNQYEKIDIAGKGILKISKKAVNAPADGMTYKVAVAAFKNNNRVGFVQDINGTIANDIKYFDISDNETKIIKGLSLDYKYKVSERYASGDQITGYNWTVKGNGTNLVSGYGIDNNNPTMDSELLSVSSDAATSYAITNEYTQKNYSFVIQKSFKNGFGDPSADVNMGEGVKDLTFTIEGGSLTTPIVKKYSEFQNGTCTVDLPLGTYTVTESDMSAGVPEGYIYSGTFWNCNSANTDGTTATIDVEQYSKTLNFTNVYAEPGSLEINKNVTGLDSQDAKLSYKVSVINSEGMYLSGTSTNGVISACSFVPDKTYLDVPAGGKLTIDNIPIGKYQINEDTEDAQVEGYDLQVTGVTGVNGIGEFTVTSGNTTIANIQNEYTKTNYAITISKEANVELTAGGYQIAVKKGEQFLQDNGDFNGTAHYFSVNNGESKKLKVKESGTYQVVEKNEDVSENDFYTLATTYVVDGSSSESGTVKVGDTNASVKVVNTYTRKSNKYNVTLNKTDSIGKSLSGAKFSISVVDGSDPLGSLDGVQFEGADANASTSEFITSGNDLIIKNLVPGTYQLKELVAPTSYDIAAPVTFTISNTGTISVTGIESRTDVSVKDSTISIVDEKSQPEIGNLVISKTISGTTLDKLETIRFTVVNSADSNDTKVVPDLKLANVGTGADQWKDAGNGKYTYEIKDLPAGATYKVTETLDGHTTEYALDTTTSTTTPVTSAAIKKDDKVTVEITDAYTKIETKGKLVITKTVTSPLTEDEYKGKLYFVISKFEGQNTTGYIQDTNGSLDATNAKKFTIVDNFNKTAEVDNLDGTTTRTYELVINNVPAGNYKVTETNDTIDGYELTKSITPNSVTIDNNSTTGSFDITDTYTVNPNPSGKIYITKNDAINMKELENAHIVVTKADGTPVDEWDTTTTAHELSVEQGNYIMTETGAPDGYQKVTTNIAFSVTIDASGKVSVNCTDTNVKIDDQDASKLALLNQPYKGSLKLTKTLKGAVTDEDRKGLSFTVTGPYNYNKTFALGTDFTPNSDKTYYELVLNDMPVGDYNVTETLTKTDGTTCTVTYKVNGGETKSGTSSTASVTNGNTTTVDYENNYTKNVYEVKISKVDATNKKEIAGAQLELYAIDANGNQIAGGYDKKWTSTTSVQTFTDITAGDYAIRELVAPEGYEKVETLFKFRVSFDANGKATVTSLGTDLPGSYDSEKDLITFENDPIKVTSEKGGMKVVVEEEGTGRRVPNATVEIEAPNGVKFPDGSTKIIVTTDENGEVTGYKDKSGKFIDLTTGLTPGDYKITVTKVPEGYKVTTGKTEVVTVKPGEVAEHLALIGTAVKKDEQTTEKTTETTTEKTTETTTQKPSDTPSTEVKQPNTTTTPNAPSTPQKDTTVVNTGDSTNVVPIIIVMIISLVGIIFLVSRKRKMRYEY